MKTKILLTSLCLVLLAGCNHNKVDAPISNEELTNAPQVIEHLSESQKNEKLESLVIDYYKIPSEYYEQTAYYYNYIDLDDDGNDEIFAVFIGPYMSGSGGSTAAIISQSSEAMEVLQSFTLIHTPLLISDEKTNGFRDIIAVRSGGGVESEFVKLAYEDNQYATINDGEVIDSLDLIFGDSIITNDIVKDREDNTLLTLQ